MHWLNHQLEQLHNLVARQDEYDQLAQKSVTGAEEGRKQAREDFLSALKELVSQIAQKEGVTAAFSCHEGLLIEKAGNSDNFEAMAAVGQNLVFNGNTATQSLKMGELMQIVVVGQETKLAVFIMGQVEIGVEAGRDVNLTTVLG